MYDTQSFRGKISEIVIGGAVNLHLLITIIE